MERLEIAYKIVYYLILFLLSLLIYFMLFLVYSHFRTKFIISKKAKISLVFSNYLNGIKVKRFSVKKILNPTGVEAISELIGNISEEDRLKLRDYLIMIKFDQYIHKRGIYFNKNMQAYAIKLIGNLKLPEMENLIGKLILKHKDSIDIQYVGFEALSKLGSDDELIRTLNNEAFHIRLTYRAIQTIFRMYPGDKIAFYEKLLDIKDDYVVRIAIKEIGNETITALAPKIRKFMNTHNKDMKIAAISSLGMLKDQESYEVICSFLQDMIWEVRSAAVKALAQIDLEASVPFLMEGLKDAQWWVRYNSAEALVHSKDIHQIYEQVARSDDKFAKEILKYTIEKLSIQRRNEDEKHFNTDNSILQ